MIPARLPLWRLLAAIVVLGGMAAVLIALAPVYIENYRLQQYIRSLVRSPATSTTPEAALRGQILDRARQLDLPILPGEVQITHEAGKLHVQMKYAVQMNFSLYQVDLHFHPAAAAP